MFRVLPVRSWLPPVRTTHTLKHALKPKAFGMKRPGNVSISKGQVVAGESRFGMRRAALLQELSFVYALGQYESRGEARPGVLTKPDIPPAPPLTDDQEA